MPNEPQEGERDRGSSREAADESGEGKDLFEEVNLEAEAELVDVDEVEKETYAIPKRWCHKCEYLSDPPEVGCGRVETEVVRTEGVDKFVVVNCPEVVKEESLRS